MGVRRPAAVRGPRRAARLLAVAVVAFLGMVLVPQAFAGTFVVNSTSDSPSGACSDTCTLRDAINAANIADGPSTITFSGQLSIAVNTNLPAITAPVTIDGSISPSKVGVTIAAGGNVTQGLEFQSGSDGSVIRGLAFGGFAGQAQAPRRSRSSRTATRSPATTSGCSPMAQRPTRTPPGSW